MELMDLIMVVAVVVVSYQLVSQVLMRAAIMQMVTLAHLDMMKIELVLHMMVGKTGVVMDMCCLLYTSPSPRDLSTSRMPSSA